MKSIVFTRFSLPLLAPMQSLTTSDKDQKDQKNPSVRRVFCCVLSRFQVRGRGLGREGFSAGAGTVSGSVLVQARRIGGHGRLTTGVKPPKIMRLPSKGYRWRWPCAGLS